MTRKEIRNFVREQLLTKPIGKWNVIYSIWRGLIVLWWNTLLIWAASNADKFYALMFIYGFVFLALVFIYAIAKGK